MMWHIFIGWFLTSRVLTRVRIVGKWDEDTWPNLEAPRVTHYLAIGFMQNIVEAVGFDPRTSHHTNIRPTNTPLHVS
jgi:hypothetical protein